MVISVFMDVVVLVALVNDGHALRARMLESAHRKEVWSYCACDEL